MSLPLVSTVSSRRGDNVCSVLKEGQRRSNSAPTRSRLGAAGLPVVAAEAAVDDFRGFRPVREQQASSDEGDRSVGDGEQKYEDIEQQKRKQGQEIGQCGMPLLPPRLREAEVAGPVAARIMTMEIEPPKEEAGEAAAAVAVMPVTARAIVGSGPKQQHPLSVSCIQSGNRGEGERFDAPRHGSHLGGSVDAESMSVEAASITTAAAVLPAVSTTMKVPGLVGVRRKREEKRTPGKGPVLVPWPSRVSSSRYQRFGGSSGALAVNQRLRGERGSGSAASPAKAAAGVAFREEGEAGRDLPPFTPSPKITLKRRLSGSWLISGGSESGSSGGGGSSWGKERQRLSVSRTRGVYRTGGPSRRAQLLGGEDGRGGGNSGGGSGNGRAGVGDGKTSEEMEGGVRSSPLVSSLKSLHEEEEKQGGMDLEERRGKIPSRERDGESGGKIAHQEGDRPPSLPPPPAPTAAAQSLRAVLRAASSRLAGGDGCDDALPLFSSASADPNSNAMTNLSHNPRHVQARQPSSCPPPLPGNLRISLPLLLPTPENLPSTPPPSTDTDADSVSDNSNYPPSATGTAEVTRAGRRGEERRMEPPPQLFFLQVPGGEAYDDEGQNPHFEFGTGLNDASMVVPVTTAVELGGGQVSGAGSVGGGVNVVGRGGNGSYDRRVDGLSFGGVARSSSSGSRWVGPPRHSSSDDGRVVGSSSASPGGEFHQHAPLAPSLLSPPLSVPQPPPSRSLLLQQPISSSPGKFVPHLVLVSLHAGGKGGGRAARVVRASPMDSLTVKQVTNKRTLNMVARLIRDIKHVLAGKKENKSRNQNIQFTKIEV